MKCQKCGHENPEHAVNCGNCVTGLDCEYSNSVTPEGSPLSWPPSDAYIAGRFLGTSGYATKDAAVVIYGGAIFIIAIGSLLIAVDLGLLWGCFSCLFLASVLYLAWRRGRKGAGWND